MILLSTQIQHTLQWYLLPYRNACLNGPSLLILAIRGSRKFCQRGLNNFDNVFFSVVFDDEIQMTFAVPMMNNGLVALRLFRRSGPVLLRNPLFCDYSGGGGGVGTPSSPSGFAHPRKAPKVKTQPKL